MKKSILITAIVFISTFCYAQIKDPVHWTYTAKQIKGANYEIRLSATIDNGWHLYSQRSPVGGPVPTTVKFTKNPLVTMDGKVKEEGELEKKYEPLFGVNVMQYSGKIAYVQKLKLRSAGKTAISGTIEFMVCNDKECLPPKTVKFSVNLK